MLLLQIPPSAEEVISQPLVCMSAMYSDHINSRYGENTCDVGSGVTSRTARDVSSCSMGSSTSLLDGMCSGTGSVKATGAGAGGSSCGTCTGTDTGTETCFGMCIFLYKQERR